MQSMQDLIRVLEGATPEELEAVDEVVLPIIDEREWIPNIGPQTEAAYTEADETFYGGSAGGGKSALALGLAITQHTKSLILRRYVDDATDLAEAMLETLGTRNGWNGQKLRLRYNGRTIDFGGCKEEKHKQRYKGDPHDLIVFDELPDFLQSQYEFIIAWNRSVDKDQRCRIVATGNPPTEAEGLWVIQRWAPWLDPAHENPAESGELRWFIRNEEGRDTEVPGPGKYDVAGRRVRARSRTFIRARLDDNPDLTQTDDYQTALDALPKELQAAYRDGKFDASIQDNPHQVIPTDWVRQAQKRWREKPPFGIPQCAIGVDGARSKDQSVLAIRHDGWYDKLIAVPGASTPTGNDLAALVIKHRRDASIITLDVLESVGAQAYQHLKDNDIECYAYRGNDEAIERTAEKQLGFYNKRAAAYWRLREALDPGQDGGSPIDLPDDPELTADLTVLTFEISPRGIKVLTKEKVVEKLGGRSPDKGDAVVMGWYKGPRAMTHIQVWQPDERVGPGQRSKRRPGVNMGPRRGRG